MAPHDNDDDEQVVSEFLSSSLGSWIIRILVGLLVIGMAYMAIAQSILAS